MTGFFKKGNKGSNDEIPEDSQLTVKDVLESLNLISENIRITNDHVIGLYQILHPEFNTEQKSENVKREIEEFKKYIKEEIIKELRQNIEKGHYLNTETVAKSNSLVQELNESLLITRGFLEEALNKQMKELMEQRQDFGNLRRKIEDFAVDFFQYMERTLEFLPESNDENVQSSKQVITKVLQDFEKRVRDHFSLERISPSQGDDLDEFLHQAIDEKESIDVQPGKIIDCKEWGYRINGQLYKDKRAKVILAKAPEQNLSGEEKLNNKAPEQNSSGEEKLNVPDQ